MPVETPTFQPEGTPDSALQAFDSGQSWAARQQNMRVQKEAADRAQDEYDIARPYKQAKTVADIATAQAAMNNATRMQELKIKAATTAKEANDAFIDANTLADYNAKASALAEVQAKYSWMEMFPEYKPFVDAVKNARAEAHVSAIADAKLEEQLSVADDNREQRAEAAALRASTATDVANIQAGAKTDAAKTAADSRESVAATTAAGRREAAKLKVDRQYELEVTIEKRDDAIRKGDTEKAQIYQDHLNKMNATAEGSPARTLPTSVPAKAAPADAAAPTEVHVTIPGAGAPAAVHPDAAIVKVDGKTYRVFKDKDGNRAYMKDGVFVEIPDEEEKPAAEPE